MTDINQKSIILIVSSELNLFKTLKNIEERIRELIHFFWRILRPNNKTENLLC